MSNKRRWEDRWEPDKRVCREEDNGWTQKQQKQTYRDPFSIEAAPATFGSSSQSSNFRRVWETSDNMARNKRKRSVEEDNNNKRTKARNPTPEPPCELFSGVNPLKRQREEDEMDFEDEIQLKRRKMEVEETSENEPLQENTSRKRKFGFDPVIRKRIRTNEFAALAARCVESAATHDLLTRLNQRQNNFIR